MTVRVSRAGLAEIIRTGRERRLSDDEVAGEIFGLLTSGGAWGKTFQHPLRGEIVDLLEREGPMSPVQMTRRLEGDTTVGALAYHFRVLEKHKVIEVDCERQRRGAVEHVYRLAQHKDKS
jgi:DNA-binding transcriptional ArsR family regulator